MKTQTKTLNRKSSGTFVAMGRRCKASVMKDRRAPRGGAKNRQAEYRKEV